MIPPVAGYLDRLSRRPGERFAAHVSVTQPGPCTARVVRVVSADPNPAGPGLDLRPVPGIPAIAFEGTNQPVTLGSLARVPGVPPMLGAVTWASLVWLRQDIPAATVLSLGEGLVLRVGNAGAEAEVSAGGQVLKIATGAPVAAMRWYRLWISHDPANGRIVLGQQALEGGPVGIAEGMLPPGPLPRAETLLIAARGGAAPHDHFSGKIEDVLACEGLHTAWPEPLDAPGAIRARWDFARDMAGETIHDTGPLALHGVLVNAPTRAVMGARWTGAEHCWRHAPAEYAAIHFHADDLDDCGWAASFHFDVPAGMPSGSYAFHVTGEGGEDWLPFYVLPPRGKPGAAVAFLASTFTYMAYANHARGNANDAHMARIAAWGAYPHNPDHARGYGFSTYNRHADGSGIAFSSRLRPVLTMRPGFLTFNDARGSGLRHYPADSHLTAWLDARGIPFDVITDEDLDDEGAALLAPYRVVLTGSHPEYHTGRMLDALTTYRDTGGKLCYLGGNGFYWRIARDPARPHRIEVRRAEGGIRAWDAEPGEYYQQLDGQLGGLWRRNRRPPQMLAGVGFSAQGLFEGTDYVRLPASHDPAVAWIMDGVPERFGDYGLSGGGAAGFELDRADPRLGTPAGTVVLARSGTPPSSFVTVPEELLSHIATVTGEKPAALQRAEIVYFEVPGGGAVFAVGSITFCGSLWDGSRFGGPVSRLLENVVRRFAGMPPGAG